MRWLGNKIQLLDEILHAAERAGFSGGTVCDLFAGSGTVGRFFRSRGYKVISTDLMHCSLAFQKVFLECPGPPRFEGVRHIWQNFEPLEKDRIKNADPADPVSWEPFLRLIHYLEQELPLREGLLYRQFSPQGTADRRYLSPDNAGRLDAMVETIRGWRLQKLIDEHEMWLLVTCIIDAADRVANISGTYGAYLKKWQKNALNPLTLRAPALVQGPIGQANHLDAITYIEKMSCDLLYIDPPYNQRQYAANYHLPEVISLLPLEESDDQIESQLYGKTGLLPWKESASPLCSRRGSECRDAMASIISKARAGGIVFSYSEEGILTRDEIEELLQRWSTQDLAEKHGKIEGSEKKQILHEIPYRRFRSDRERQDSQAGTSRSFHPAEGRSEDEVHEWIFAIEKLQAERC
ncbi:MAG: DNA adenine methylase [Planctomycetota bacterium]|nr:DNA adenine methylase [Planctomycetota bacterium]